MILNSLKMLRKIRYFGLSGWGGYVLTGSSTRYVGHFVRGVRTFCPGFNNRHHGRRDGKSPHSAWAIFDMKMGSEFVVDVPTYGPVGMFPDSSGFVGNLSR